jgi:hypothetical protein
MPVRAENDTMSFDGCGDIGGPIAKTIGAVNPLP